MTVFFPEATPVHLNIKLSVVNAIAAQAAPEVADEVKAGTSLDLSCFVRGWNPEISTNSGSAPDRLCSSLNLPQEGKTQLSAIPIAYVYDPQAATSTDDNKARLKLVQGTELFVVVRKGLPYTTDWAATQYVETWKVRCDPGREADGGRGHHARQHQGRAVRGSKSRDSFRSATRHFGRMDWSCSQSPAYVFTVLQSYELGHPAHFSCASMSMCMPWAACWWHTSNATRRHAYGAHAQPQSGHRH